jgi:hypothetical protein
VCDRIDERKGETGPGTGRTLDSIYNASTVYIHRSQLYKPSILT